MWIDWTPEMDIALEYAITQHDGTDYFTSREVVLTFLEMLNSDDRNFSDEMLERRKRYRQALKDNPEECPSYLWENIVNMKGGDAA